MSSSSTTWTTDTNTKSGTVQIYDSSVSTLRITAGQSTNAILELFADEGDTNSDKWRLWVNDADDDLHFANYTSGSWADLLTIQDGGNVGIGESSPVSRLSVGAGSDTAISDGAKAVSDDGLTVSVSTDDKFTAGFMNANAGGDGVLIKAGDSANEKALGIEDYDGANNLFVVRGDGNVGIGTSSPDQILHVDDAAGGNILLSRSEGSIPDDGDDLGVLYWGGKVNGAFNYGAYIKAVAAEQWVGETEAGTDLHFGTQVIDGTNLATGNPAMVILDSGNVGIGTASPGYKLEVAGTSLFGTTAAGAILMLNGEAGLSNRWDLSTTVVAGLQIISNASPKMTILDTGNVGIGTASPDHALEVSVNNSAPITGSNIADNTALGVHIANTNDSDADGCVLKFSSASDGSYSAIAHIQIDENDADLAFYTSTGGALNEAIRIDNGGNVGIGDTSPSAKLEVNGSFAANGPNSTFVTFPESDTTPNVEGGNIFKTHSTGVTMTEFDGGVCGQIITIISGGTAIYDVDDGELKAGTTDITTNVGDVTMWVCESATIWHLLSWMDVSQNLADGSDGF